MGPGLLFIALLLFVINSILSKCNLIFWFCKEKMVMVKEGELSRFEVEGWAARDDSGILSPINFTRGFEGWLTLFICKWMVKSSFISLNVLICIGRETGSNDVTNKVAYCRIYHSDLHQIRNEWKNSEYPMVPGVCN